MTNHEKWNLFLAEVESPECYLEWGFYATISAALQRRVWIDCDRLTGMPNHNSLFPNIWPWLVGPPATGKGRVINGAMAILQSSKLEKPDVSGHLRPLIPWAPDSTTLEALTSHIADHTKAVSFKVVTGPSGDMSYHDIKHTEGDIRNYGYSPCAFLIEELEVLFKTKSHDMVAALCHMYDAHDMHYKTKTQGEDKLKNICVTMLTGTTPDSIRDLVAAQIIKKGLASRALMIYADKPRFYRLGRGSTITQQQACLDLIAHVRQLTTVLGEIKMSPEAREWFEPYYESGKMTADRLNNSPYLDHFYGRMKIHVQKLAMVLLFAEQTTSYVMQLEHVKKALEIIRRAEVRMHEAFNASGRNPLYESTVEMVRWLGEKERVDTGVKYNKLWWTFSRDLDKQQFEQCIELLHATGQAKTENGYIILMPVAKNGH